MVALVYISNMLGAILDSAYVAEQAHKVQTEGLLLPLFFAVLCNINFALFLLGVSAVLLW
jgi:hypothetical protein